MSNTQVNTKSPTDWRGAVSMLKHHVDHFLLASRADNSYCLPKLDEAMKATLSVYEIIGEDQVDDVDLLLQRLTFISENPDYNSVLLNLIQETKDKIHP